MTASLSDAACAKGAGAWASVGAAGVPIGPEAAGRGGADEHYELTQTERSAWGRCSIWWRNTPDLSGRRTGLIGHFASNDRVLSGRVLRQACAALAARGCAVAVGPMDGSTWRPYRLVTERGTEPPFFLEPDHPPEWPEDFCEAGFAPVAEYFSAVTDRLDCEDPRADRAEARLLGLGIEVRSLDAQRWEEELGEVYRVTLNSFRDAFLYQPLPSAEFHALYGRLRPVVVPELVLLARHRGRAVGYVVGIPDRLQAARGAALDTVILKTLAILPERTYAGLGSYLVHRLHRAAGALGYRRVIHALMHETNASRNISARYGKPFRRYTLFARPL